MNGKGRQFRSEEGCCICLTKSSTSRFTTSAKYDVGTLVAAFKLPSPRSGPICNPCVLRVRRYCGAKGRASSENDDKRRTDNLKHAAKIAENNNRILDVGQASRPWKTRKSAKTFPARNDDNGGSPAASPDDFYCRKYVFKSKTKKRLINKFSKPVSPTWKFKTEYEKKKIIELATQIANDRRYSYEELCCGTFFDGPFGKWFMPSERFQKCCGAKKQGAPQMTPHAMTVKCAFDRKEREREPPPKDDSSVPVKINITAVPIDSGVDSATSASEASSEAASPEGSTKDESTDLDFDDLSNMSGMDLYVRRNTAKTTATCN